MSKAAVTLALLLVAVPGCATAFFVPRFCADGAPPRILQHPDCRRGICGYTCSPDRWKDPPR